MWRVEWLAGFLVDHSHRSRRPAATTWLHGFDDEIASFEGERALLLDRLFHHGERRRHHEVVSVPGRLRHLFLAAHARVLAFGAVEGIGQLDGPGVPAAA